ncbi:MAG: DUF2277 domain-containing protein [Gemmatimonadetes bacterium]|nr:DUF2277 domain-containing protein [Gemmatimonadota bacterium]
MCRNIRTLHNFDPSATEDEVRAAALQYVRKISGSTKPSQANAAAFERAVDVIAEASAELLSQLVTSAPPKDREVEAAKAKARSATRYAAWDAPPLAAVSDVPGPRGLILDGLV